MKTPSHLLSATRVIMTLALIGSFHVALAQPTTPTGVYDLLTFPNCTGYSLNSTLGVVQPGPSNYVETMTDGLGNVVFARTSTGSIGTFFFWGANPFTLQPQANPIHEHIVMDGVVISDVFASSTCFATPVPSSTPTTLVVLAALLSLAGMWAIRRKWVQSRATRR
jgi:hypothetical protein